MIYLAKVWPNTIDRINTFCGLHLKTILFRRDLLESLLLLCIYRRHLLILQLLDLLVQPSDIVRRDELRGTPLGMVLGPPAQLVADLLSPGVAHLLDALGLLVRVLGDDLDEQLELVVRVVLRLLVEVWTRLHRAHDRLDVLGLVDQDADVAPALVRHLGQLPQRVCVARVLVWPYAQRAHHVGVEAPADPQLLQLVLVVLVDALVGELDVGEVEGVFGVGLGAFGVDGFRLVGWLLVLALMRLALLLGERRSCLREASSADMGMCMLL